MPSDVFNMTHDPTMQMAIVSDIYYKLTNTNAFS
jgi:hypothetical protein